MTLKRISDEVLMPILSKHSGEPLGRVVDVVIKAQRAADQVALDAVYEHLHEFHHCNCVWRE